MDPQIAQIAQMKEDRVMGWWGERREFPLPTTLSPYHPILFFFFLFICEICEICGCFLFVFVR